MVIKLKKTIFYLIFILVLNTGIIANSLALTSNNISQISYHIDKEWAVLWINEDSTVELHYNITITYESAAQGYLGIGLPTSGFKILSVTDITGKTLSYTDTSSGNYYGVEVYFGHAMSPGSSGTVILEVTVPNMLSSDSMNPGYVGMQFMPTYFSDAEVIDLRVVIVPPAGVTSVNIKTSETAYLTTVDGAFAVYWERSNLAPNTQLTFGVSIPQQYVTLPGPDIGFYLIIASAIVVVIVVFIILLRQIRKAVYEKPKISIEALGAAKGLTAVEAAVVLNIKPVRVLTMILFSLLLKRQVIIKETDPLIKLETIKAPSSENTPAPLRYYEIDFLKAVGTDGLLNESLLARTYLSLKDNVDKKMRGYSRVDTVNYYKSVVGEAWNQITQAGTPELKGDAIDKNIEWLLVDEQYDERFRRAFPSDLIIMPSPYWYWYWRGPYTPERGIPSTQTPTPAQVKPVPAQEWANNLVRGMEKMSNNIVKNVQDFSNKLVASTTTQSSTPVHHGSSCVCACAHCACACACVGCACACAGGHGR